MASKNTDPKKKWFLVSFESESSTINECSDTFVVFCTADKVLDPASLEANHWPKLDKWNRLNAIYKSLDGYSTGGNVTAKILTKGVKDMLKIYELTPEGKRLKRSDLVASIYSEKVIIDFLAQVKAPEMV